MILSNLNKFLGFSLIAQIMIGYFLSPWALLTIGLISLFYIASMVDTLSIDDPAQLQEHSPELIRIKVHH